MGFLEIGLGVALVGYLGAVLWHIAETWSANDDDDWPMGYA